MPMRNTRRKNSGEYDNAVGVAEGFHGRGAEEEFDIAETTHYDKNLAQLGLLCELEILLDSESDEVQPINFGYKNNNPIRLCATADREQLVLVGGDQNLDEILTQLGYDLGKRQILIGEIHSISYASDKHHLEGSSGKEEEYQHEFGEMGGEKPYLGYNTMDRVMEIVGGGYEIRDEGIWD